MTGSMTNGKYEKILKQWQHY